MRLIFSIIAIGFLLFGILMIIVSFSKNLTVSAPNFSAAVFGFGLIGIAMIVGLLVAVLKELKNKNNPH